MPQPVRSLLAVASLKLTCLALGVTEIATFRNQIRVRPMEEGRGLELAAAVSGASYHGPTKTLNLELPTTMSGEELVLWIERTLGTIR